MKVKLFKKSIKILKSLNNEICQISYINNDIK